MKKTFIAIFAAVMLVAFVAPAMAKVDVGGIVFTDFYYQSYSDARQQAGPPIWHLGPLEGTAKTAKGFGETRLEVPSGSRFKFRWSNEDNVGMFIEIGIGGADGAGGTTDDRAVRGDPGFRKSFTMRHAYGWWDINPAVQLMFGHSTTPFSPLVPQQFLGTEAGTLHIIGLGYGEFYSGRFPQVRFTFNYPNDMGRLGIALVTPQLTPYGTEPATIPIFPGPPLPETGGTVVENTKLPRLDVGSPLYFGNLKLYPGFFVQQRTLDQVASGKPDSVTSWGLSIGGRYVFGPFDFSGEFNYGKNWGVSGGSIGISPPGFFSAPQGFDTDLDGFLDVLEDTTSYTWFVSLGMKVGPATPTLTVGQANSQNDGLVHVNTPNSDWDVSAQMIGVTCPIGLAKGFLVRPEFFYYDNGDDNKYSGDVLTRDNGTEWILGLEFQVVF